MQKISIKQIRRYAFCLFEALRPTERKAGGPYPLMAAFAFYFGLLKILFLEHHSTTRQQTMMEKGIITFKHNSPVMFFRFFAKLLATNCCAI